MGDPVTDNAGIDVDTPTDEVLGTDVEGSILSPRSNNFEVDGLEDGLFDTDGGILNPAADDVLEFNPMEQSILDEIASSLKINGDEITAEAKSIVLEQGQSDVLQDAAGNDWSFWTEAIDVDIVHDVLQEMQ